MGKMVANTQEQLKAMMLDALMGGMEYPLSIEIKEHKAKRSLSQNALYWVWLDYMAKHFSKKVPSCTDEQMHDLMRHKFLGYEDKTIGRTEIKGQLASTKKLEVAAMSEYMMKIEAWAAEHGCLLPVVACKAYQDYREAAQ